MYKIKHNSNGSIQCLKVHLVSQGYNHNEGVNFTYGYSPMVKPTIVRCILGIAVTRGWRLWQINVPNTFLNEDINEVVCLR